MAILEVACFSAKSAAIACETGAHRIELCDDCPAGGTTPTRECVLQTVALARRRGIPVYAMIRPRGGDFVYSDEEYAVMKDDIRAYRAHVDGFVLGILTPAHEVDIARTAALANLAHPLPCTFHRAFDQTNNLLGALDDVIAAGCKAVLTSGGAQSAPQGMAALSKLVQRSEGRVQIIPGGGVRSQNLDLLRRVTGATCFHTSALIKSANVPDSVEISLMLSTLQNSDELDSPRTASPTPPSETDNEQEGDLRDMGASAVWIGPASHR